MNSSMKGSVVLGRRAVHGGGVHPGAVHGGISCDLTLLIHCCSGEPDDIVSIDLIDFEPGRGIIRPPRPTPQA